MSVLSWHERVMLNIKKNEQLKAENKQLKEFIKSHDFGEEVYKIWLESKDNNSG